MAKGGKRMTVNELQYLHPCVRVEVLTAVKIKNTVVQDVASCTLIDTVST